MLEELRGIEVASSQVYRVVLDHHPSGVSFNDFEQRILPDMSRETLGHAIDRLEKQRVVDAIYDFDACDYVARIVED